MHLVDQDQKYWNPRRPRRPRRSDSAPDAQAAETATAPAPGETIDGVIVDKVAHEHTAILGPVLGMDKLLEQLGLNQSQSLAAAAQAPTAW